MVDIIGKTGAIEIRMLMAEAPLDILIAVSARKALIINWMGYLRLVDSYIASLPTYTTENAMPCLYLSFLAYLFFASFLAMISASSSAISLSTFAPLLGSLPCNFA